MRVVFMGTPEFARATLTALCESDHDVLAVVTGPDQKAGRGRKLLPTACRREADHRGLQVLMPKSLKSEQLYQALEALNPDIFVVAAFRILPEKLFSLPKYGSVNVHASLLPKYRGAAPINWALINGEEETGLTSFLLKKSVDTGDIILKKQVEIRDDDTFDSLYERLSRLSGPFVLETLDKIESGEFTPESQDDSQATRAPKLTPFDAQIDWGFPAENVRNFVRGMSTTPGAWTTFRGKKLKVHYCTVADESGAPDTRPGTILPHKKRLLVQCDKSAVELTRVVPQGKQEMEGTAFLNGYRPEPGEVLGEKLPEKEENR